MNKKAFTLVEVLVSVALLSLMITTIFQIKENNLFYLEKFKASSKYNELISLATITENNSNKLRNENIYLDKFVDFNDDDIRKELKNVKVNVKDIESDIKDLSSEEFSFGLNIKQSIYSIEDKVSSNIYKFTLEYE